MTTSIGIVERPVADTNPADLIQAADITLHWAKTDGKARYAMFDVTAEGRETPTQYERFRAMGCEASRGDGSLSGLPGTAEQIDALLQAHASTGQRSPDVYLGDTMTISSCEIKPEGGPPLGRFILQRTNDKWYITGHETEKC